MQLPGTAGDTAWKPVQSSADREGDRGDVHSKCVHHLGESHIEVLSFKHPLPMRLSCMSGPPMVTLVC